MQTIRQLFLVSLIFSSDIFFATSSVLGFKYEGSDTSNALIAYTAITLCALIILTAKKITTRELLLKRNDRFLLIPPLFILFSYISSIVYHGHLDQKANDFFISFLVSAIPAYFAGYILAKTESKSALIICLDPLLIIFSLSVYTNALQYFSEGQINFNERLLEYQRSSYFSALVFGISSYIMISESKSSRYIFTRSWIYKSFIAFTIPSSLLLCMSSGGRGGIVLISAYILFIFISKIFNSKINKKSINSIPIFLGLAIILASTTNILVENFLVNDTFRRGFDRTFEFLNSSGINWEGSSGRDSIYIDSLKLISNSLKFHYKKELYLIYYDPT